MKAMEQLSIYIPTLSRPTRQRTLANLLGVHAEHTYLVVQPQEEAAYREANPGANLVVLPEREGGWDLPKTRQWIHENAATRYVVQMDDDLDFHHRPYQHLDEAERPEGEPHTRLKPCGADEVRAMLQAVRMWLSGYPMVGVSAREGNVFTKEASVFDTRQMRFLATDRVVLDELGLRWDAVADYEDFNMVLGLLVRGKRNVVIFEYAQGQPGSNTAGGCSVYRTDEYHARGAHHLARRFPGFVRVVTRRSTNWGAGMTERTDVRVAWKRAGEAGRNLWAQGEAWVEGPHHSEFHWEPEPEPEPEPAPGPAGAD